MIILDKNSGSSSLKFQLFAMPGEKLLMKGKAVKNEKNKVEFYFHPLESNISFHLDKFSHRTVFARLFDELVHPESECLTSITKIDAVGHRLIHDGGKSSG